MWGWVGGSGKEQEQEPKGANMPFAWCYFRTRGFLFLKNFVCYNEQTF